MSVYAMSEAVGVIPTDNFDATKLKLTAYFTPRRNEEYEVFTFRQTQQISLRRVRGLFSPVSTNNFISD